MLVTYGLSFAARLNYSRRPRADTRAKINEQKTTTDDIDHTIFCQSKHLRDQKRQLRFPFLSLPLLHGKLLLCL